MGERSSGPHGKVTGPAARRERFAALGSAMRDFRRNAEMIHDRLAKLSAIHPTDFNCIGYLHHNGPTAPRDIIAYLGLTSGSGTALFDRLENDGYIKRLPNPIDRRSVLIALDEARAAPLVSRYLEFEELFLDSMAQYDDRELDLLADFFRKLQDITTEIEHRVVVSRK